MAEEVHAATTLLRKAAGTCKRQCAIVRVHKLCIDDVTYSDLRIAGTHVTPPTGFHTCFNVFLVHSVSAHSQGLRKSVSRVPVLLLDWHHFHNHRRACVARR